MPPPAAATFPLACEVHHGFEIYACIPQLLHLLQQLNDIVWQHQHVAQLASAPRLPLTAESAPIVGICLLLCLVLQVMLVSWGQDVDARTEQLASDAARCIRERSIALS